VYIECLERRILGATVERARLQSPFLLRSVTPPIADAHGRTVASIERMGKRIVIGLQGDLYLVFHLMIAGRFRWRETGAVVPKKLGLAAFDFSTGTLLLTEAGTKKQASLHVVGSRAGLEEHDRGGLEVMEASLRAFADALRAQNRTLKRAMTAPRTLSGIGNAYSDEILHAARLSPLQLTRNLHETEMRRLFDATQTTLNLWLEKTREEVGDGFPEKVTAFREGMAVHGRYGQPCPVCGSPIQRIVYVRNETNYCATCQTDGRLLADRAFSRLLKKDWPKTLEAWMDGD